MAIMNATTDTAMTHSLGGADQIPLGEGRMFHVGNRLVAVFRARHGAVYATQAWCTHQEGPLADGLIGGSTLVCPLHQFRFNLDTGEPLGNDCSPLQTFPVSISDAGEILLSL